MALDQLRFAATVMSPTSVPLVLVETITSPVARGFDFARRAHHPGNVHFIVEKEWWMGGAIYGNVFASRAHFLECAMDFETRLAAAKTVKGGHFLRHRIRMAQIALAGHFHAQGTLKSVFINTLVPWDDLVGEPNEGHAAVADFLICGAAHAALSANFDGLIEQWSNRRKVASPKGKLNYVSF